MLSYMKYIYEVYKERNFSKAAANLGLSQPALSTAVKKAEQEAGVVIFDRSTSPLSLTEAGRVFIASVEVILKEEHDLLGRLNDMANLDAGHIKIGGSNFFSSFLLPHAISKFSKLHPGITIDLYEAHLAQLNQALLSDELDLVMDSFEFNPRHYTSYPILKEHVMVAVPAIYPLNQQLKKYALSIEDIRKERHLRPDFPAVSLSLFAREPFLLLRKGNDMGERALSLCQEAGFTPHVAIYLDHLMTSYHISCLGMGIAFITDKMLLYGYPRKEVCIYKVESPLAQRDIVFAHKKNRYVTQAMAAFLTFTQEQTFRSKKNLAL